MSTSHFIEPLDVLVLRGNKLFGEPGSYGESLIPPWPSVAAGAIRSALLAHKKIDPTRFAENEAPDEELGTPDRPGSFRITAFQLARRDKDGQVAALYPLPADLVVVKGDNRAHEVRKISPWNPTTGLLASSATEFLAVLPEPERAKPESGLWLTAQGWAAHMAGESIDAQRHLVETSELWQIDTRTGVGLDTDKRSAADGKLFSVQAVALNKREHRDRSMPSDGENADFDVGFLAWVDGAALPHEWLLRLGGDGRGAISTAADIHMPEPDYEAIASAGRCRIVLTTPGFFPGGWLPTGIKAKGQDQTFDLFGVKGKLACAAVSRAEVVSGWDLAKRQPKPAQRVAPTGSVYWLEDLQASPEQLRKLVDQGLWSEPVENPSRRAEGFNRIALAQWR